MLDILSASTHAREVYYNMNDMYLLMMYLKNSLN